MKHNICFKMELSNDENISFESKGILFNNVLKFKDNNNELNIFDLSKKDCIILTKNSFKHNYILKQFSTSHIKSSGLEFEIKSFTNSIEISNEFIKLNFDNYINNQLSNVHNLIIELKKTS